VKVKVESTRVWRRRTSLDMIELGAFLCYLLFSTYVSWILNIETVRNRNTGQKFMVRVSRARVG
jgi:hypothetical protein